MPNNTIFPDLYTKKCTFTALDVSLYAALPLSFLFQTLIAFLSGGSEKQKKRTSLQAVLLFINVNFFSLSFQSRNMEPML